jgi:hypothetical protein
MPASSISVHETPRSTHPENKGSKFQSPLSKLDLLSNSSIGVVGDDLEPSAADNLKSLVQECGVSPHKISELLQELPPVQTSDALIDYYFSSMCVQFLNISMTFKN